MIIDWKTRKTVKKKRKDWNPVGSPDLDFADDVLISAKHNQMQRKSEKCQVSASKLGMNVNISKTKVLAPVVRKVYNAIHRINHYPMDKC